MNWSPITPDSIAITGVFIGRRLGQDMAGDRLKKWFGWFVLVMGCYIIIHEIFVK